MLGPGARIQIANLGRAASSSVNQKAIERHGDGNGHLCGQPSAFPIDRMKQAWRRPIRLHAHVQSTSCHADQINGVFRQVLLAQTSKLEVLVAAESGDADFDPHESARDSERWHWVNRLLAMRGVNADVDDEAAELMRRAGVSERDIYIIAVRLQDVCASGRLPHGAANRKIWPSTPGTRLIEALVLRFTLRARFCPYRLIAKTQSNALEKGHDCPTDKPVPL
jgi:hypothetical protein